LFSLATDAVLDVPSFEVIAQIGGNLGDEAGRIGTYDFKKMYNSAASFTNGKYYIFFSSSGGWQWTSSYSAWAGNGPSLATIASAEDYVHHAQFSLGSDPVLDVADFEVVAKVGGNLGDEAGRKGKYVFDKMFNGAPAMSNGKYIIFFSGPGDGWQWTSSYGAWAGDGPSLTDVTKAEEYVHYAQFQLASDVVAAVEDIEVTARTGGNLGDEANRIGLYKFDKMYNGAPAMKNVNNKYIIFYGGPGDGWQWVGAYNQWAGDGPSLNTHPTVADFVHFWQFALASDFVPDVADFKVIAQTSGNLGGGAARLGTYSFDKMYNGAPAMTNGNYIVFYSGSNGGWQVSAFPVCIQYL
jgi:hypothetical protein